LYFSAVHLEADGAVMITGSHNPSEFNGFKTVCGSGTITAKTFRKSGGSSRRVRSQRPGLAS